ncbi:hypothetical protein D9756_000622 [Leucocoprinus leucothites]|uniref:BHLH domain-containing protein n=1 Tax=Leucocoprinus leucothites TaxID=201217 RepID=A0A8H5LNL7_9AGAR|nr:hypothetical protein D9756_000622 [Leucoagaricus leucothites]
MASSRSSSSPEATPRSVRSPMGPLAPLEYLQTQRRGSITDPQLHAAPNTSPHLRNLLRSPSLDPLPPPRSANGLPIDYNMRRHSIATQHPHGIKRKISSDRHVFAPVGEESDPHLVGPGVPSLMHLDTEPPAPKRRGSAIDTQRIAQLSLNDRRASTDSRSSAHPWWDSHRRDSTSSMLSNPSSTGYSSAYTGGDSPHNRLPPSIAAFSWPNSDNASEPTQLPSLTRPPDPNPPANTIPPLSYLADRRMSVPDTLISHPKSITPRSPRPPSRQGHPPEPITRSSSGQDNSNPQSASALAAAKKDSGPTPYSRSPELRVSHKLAERKRRKEMKDLFDELRDQLPADRGMKASKWEILTKAIDFVVQLKQSNQDMMREIERLRQEVDIARGGPGYSPAPPPSSSHVVYGQPSQVPVVPSQGPPPPLLQPPLPGPSQLPLSRPPTQNVYPSLTSNPPPNGGHHRSEPSPP